jgi:hypothetical protein
MERLNLDRFAISAAAVTLAMFAGTVCAETEVYAQANRSVNFTDDGYSDNTMFVDNEYSRSRLGLKSMAHLNKCVTFGGVAETGINPNNSRSLSQIQTTDIFTNALLVRKMEAWVSGGMWGKLTLGFGEAATYGITRMSYSGAGETVSSSRVADTAGGLRFHPQGSQQMVTPVSPQINQVFNSLDGVGSFDLTGLFREKNRVRYDSDKWNGLSFAASHGGVGERFRNSANLVDVTPTRRTFTDAALRYEGDFDDFMLAAGVGYVYYTRDGLQSEDDTTTPLTASRGQRIWSGSVAAEHKCSGFNAAFSYGVKRKMVTSKANQKSWFAQVGKHFDWTHYGKTNLVVDYFSGKAALVKSDRSKSWGVGAVQNFDKVNTSLYASWRNYSYKNGVNLSTARQNFDRINVASVGMLFKFGAML